MSVAEPRVVLAYCSIEADHFCRRGVRMVPQSAWNALITGRKRWALYPPDVIPDLVANGDKAWSQMFSTELRINPVSVCRILHCNVRTLHPPSFACCLRHQCLSQQEIKAGIPAGVRLGTGVRL